MLKQDRLAAILTVGDVDQLRRTITECAAAARSGAYVTLFFRDETIPLICRPDVAAAMTDEAGLAAGREVAAMLRDLVSVGEIHCTACSSSMYLWGVTAADLLPEIAGARGLIAFLAEDLADATRVLSG